MDSLYQEADIICKLKKKFSKIFKNETKPTKERLIDLLMSVIELNNFQSIQYNFDHSIRQFSHSKLKSYYYTLNESKVNIDEWFLNMLKTTLSLIPETLISQPIILSIDDTMIEKSGNHFEHCKRLFDHAAHNGSSYLKGHCFVSLLISIPTMVQDKIKYISIPLGYRMWTPEETKLKIASDLIKSAMTEIGSQRNVIVCCDSWYPKAEIVKLPEEYENLNLICNVRSDTALYELPPEHNGKKGRPQIRGNKISLQDFSFQQIEDTGYSAGKKTVMTNLFGKHPVFAIVTKSTNGTMRLLLCTAPPETLNFDTNCNGMDKALAYSEKDKNFLPITIYTFRWHIETAYYEQKKFWDMKDYMLRSKRGIESLINLLTILYSFMTLLPFLSSDFSFLANVSPQEARFILGYYFQKNLFFDLFLKASKGD